MPGPEQVLKSWGWECPSRLCSRATEIEELATLPKGNGDLGKIWGPCLRERPSLLHRMPSHLSIPCAQLASAQPEQDSGGRKRMQGGHRGPKRVAEGISGRLPDGGLGN